MIFRAILRKLRTKTYFGRNFLRDFIVKQFELENSLRQRLCFDDDNNNFIHHRQMRFSASLRNSLWSHSSSHNSRAKQLRMAFVCVSLDEINKFSKPISLRVKLLSRHRCALLSSVNVFHTTTNELRWITWILYARGTFATGWRWRENWRWSETKSNLRSIKGKN